MTSVQAVRSSATAGTLDLVPSGTQARYVRVKYGRGSDHAEHTVQLPESQVADFCLSLDRELHKFNANKHLGAVTENPERRAIKCVDWDVSELPPADGRFHNGVTPAWIIEMVAKQIGPQKVH